MHYQIVVPLKHSNIVMEFPTRFEALHQLRGQRLLSEVTNKPAPQLLVTGHCDRCDTGEYVEADDYGDPIDITVAHTYECATDLLEQARADV